MSRLPSVLVEAGALCILLLAYQAIGSRLRPTPTKEGNDSSAQDLAYNLVKQQLTSLKSNNSVATNSGEGSDSVLYFAAHQSPNDNYYGLHATMDVYGYQLRPGQITSTELWISHDGDGTKSSFNSADAGWHIYPEHYGDSHPHFFTHWTRDGYQTTGCLNQDCPGFVRAHGATVAPGAPIYAVSTGAGLQNITVRVLKDHKTGDWWVYYGHNSVPTAVGYYPKTLFTHMAQEANGIAFGAYAAATRAVPTPPMGSGSPPNGGPSRAASFTDLRTVGQDGRSFPITKDMPTNVGNPKCYSITPVGNNAGCSYGGPGGCVP